jgi:hypothetical protein
MLGDVADEIDGGDHEHPSRSDVLDVQIRDLCDLGLLEEALQRSGPHARLDRDAHQEAAVLADQHDRDDGQSTPTRIDPIASGAAIR